ncbi:hypothetical protein BGW37DRAFT_515863 [Umbelopsis sp. PMI_123]|nr:hypothetical protein BGW37DRAFT_515863 [Umbelopsis sp. PMI_123]
MFSAIRTTSQLTSACLARNLRNSNGATRSFHSLPPRFQLTQPGATASAKDSATNKAERTMKRFWKKASIMLVDGKYTVQLDGRNLRTPSKNKILLHSDCKQLAQLLAAEWDGQSTNLKPHSLPLTSLLSRAIDGLDLGAAEDPSIRPQVIDKLMTYLDTDTICFHEDFPDALVKLQDQYWQPILQWIEEQYGVELKVTDGIFQVKQPQETKETLRKMVENMDSLELAALERAVISSKSFLIGLALVKRGITVEQAAQAAHVEVNSQIDRWGEVEDSHDVEKEHIRQALGSVACVVMHNPKPAL